MVRRSGGHAIDNDQLRFSFAARRCAQASARNTSGARETDQGIA
jgi:hypothetical protein